MPLPQGMTQEQFLSAIAESVKRKQSGEDSTIDPRALQFMRQRRAAKGIAEWNLPIEGAKPDPEAMANAQIEAAANRGAVNLPAASNGINPETGMPFFSAPVPASPEDEERKRMNEFKLQYLKKQSQGL